MKNLNQEITTLTNEDVEKELDLLIEDITELVAIYAEEYFKNTESEYRLEQLRAATEAWRSAKNARIYYLQGKIKNNIENGK